MIALTDLVFYCLGVNLASFGVFGWDKFCASRNFWRVSERTLLTLALIGGSPGAIAGQHTFRHKTYKEPFRTHLRVIVGIQSVALMGLALAWFLRLT